MGNYIGADSKSSSCTRAHDYSQNQRGNCQRNFWLLLPFVVISLLSACSRNDPPYSPSPNPQPSDVAPLFTLQPVSQSVTAPTVAAFTTAVSGTPTPTLQWQLSTDGTTFNPIAGATTSNYSSAATTATNSGYQYRVVATNRAGTATSNVAVLTVTSAATAPAITTQPTDQSVASPSAAIFSVSATGTATLTYQWQVSIDGVSYSDIAGAIANTYNTGATSAGQNGHRYRAVVTNSVGSVTTNAAVLTVTTAAIAPSFTTQPQSQSVAAFATATFTVAIDGTPLPTLQWQVSIDSGSTWADITGATTSTFTIAATASADTGKQFRVVATNSAGSVNSNSATLTVGASATNVRYFSADNGATGAELWKSDGTTAGTVLVKDIYPGTISSSPGAFFIFNGMTYFAANDGIERGLWKTDGTAAGTVPVALGAGAGGVGLFTVFNNAIYYQGTDAVHGAELWKSDGTAAGTVMLKDINPIATIGGSPGGFTVFNGALYFQANDGPNGPSLWKTDGTAVGTVQVDLGIRPFHGISPNGLIVFAGALYFTANDDLHGNELWTSIGIDASTVMVKDIQADNSSSDIGDFTIFNGWLYFRATSHLNGAELWKTDGSALGTMQVKDINPGHSDGFPFSLVVVNNALYFQANDGINGTELWKSDGSAAGTVMVKDINPGSGRGNPTNFSVLNDELLFRANDGVTGSELWKTDGTAAGTVLVKDISPGARSSM